MDGVSIFRTREGGQTKSKLGREREEEEGCEEMINLHPTAVSGQRQLEPQRTLKEKHHWLKTQHRKLKTHSAAH